MNILDRFIKERDVRRDSDLVTINVESIMEVTPEVLDFAARRGYSYLGMWTWAGDVFVDFWRNRNE